MKSSLNSQMLGLVAQLKLIQILVSFYTVFDLMLYRYIISNSNNWYKKSVLICLISNFDKFAFICFRFSTFKPLSVLCCLGRCCESYFLDSSEQLKWRYFYYSSLPVVILFCLQWVKCICYKRVFSFGFHFLRYFYELLTAVWQGVGIQICVDLY
jgi:hypothetical protein